MRIRIVGTQLPGDRNVHVGVQRRNRPAELLGLHAGDADEAVWDLDCTAEGTDLRGPYVQGRPGGRFIYLSWGTVDESGSFIMFRRAKLMVEDVAADVLAEGAESGLLVGRLGLTDANGQPVCARVRAPQITWTAGK
jgi:hypothetical protein